MKQIFINLPVADVVKSMDFYTQLGFENNPLFTDENQKCMVWFEQVYVMLLSHQQFITYSRKALPNTQSHIAAYYTLPVESLERVNQIVDRGLKADGTEPFPMLDHGFMQLRRLQDPDGHTWDVVYMDLDKFRKG